MNASRVIILGVAVAAAAGAGYVAKRMAAQPAQMVAVQQAPDTPQLQLEDVLVLSENLPIGAAIENQLKWQPWPADAVGEGFITRTAEPEAIESLKGSIARLESFAGEPLRRSKLIGQGQSFMSSILPSGKRAVATQIAADTSAGGFILPNDFVDVIMTRRATEQGAGGSGEGFVTETILQNIRVLAVDQAIQEDEEGKRVKVGQTATLELTPQQAEIITVAQQMADRLTLSLRSITDTQEKNLAEADYLVNGEGKRGTIRLIKAGELSEQGAR